MLFARKYFLRVVGNVQQGGCSCCGNPFEQGKYKRAMLRVEAVTGFIQNEDGRAFYRGPQNEYRPLLAVGKRRKGRFPLFGEIGKEPTHNSLSGMFSRALGKTEARMQIVGVLEDISRRQPLRRG